MTAIEAAEREIERKVEEIRDCLGYPGWNGVEQILINISGHALTIAQTVSYLRGLREGKRK